MKQVIEKKDCCGCAACVNICPHNAISMVENYEGFLYPEIDEAKCVSCGLCQKACPVLSKDNNNFKKPDCYAVMADDETRKVSSSGGAFSILADYILDKKGYICGCTFDKSELKAKHIIINLKEDLYKLRGSKYVQSDIGTSYLDVKKLLENGNFVLFSGTPCQVAGLKSFLRKDYENLLTVDILCHGVPSPKVHRKYLNELLKSRDEKVINVNFRDKVRGWSPILTHTTTTTTTTTYSYIQVDDTYMQLFLNNISLRKNCTDCKFCSTQRPGDFTIADFWGIENFDKNLNDGKGTSLVLVNNIKAKNIYERLSEKFQLSKSVPLKYAILGNRNLYSPHKVHPKREEFFKDLDNFSLKQLVNLYIYHKYDCGIMNYWASWNYGAILTCYALQELVKSFGYTTQVINFHPKVWNNKKMYPRNKSKLDFVKKYFNLTTFCKNKNDLIKLNDTIETFIVGSDQVWNWGHNLKYIYFLDFVKNSKKKIACAVSMIFEKFNYGEEVKTVIEFYMKRFDAVSVRELDNVTVCRGEFDVPATCILDPVFLINNTEYEKLIKDSHIKHNKAFIAVYVFEYNSGIANAVNKLAKENDLDIIIMNKGESIEDWLYYIKNAKYVITDSYHGTCFSIIFEKQFISLTNTHGNSRFYSLLSIIGLQNRLIETKNNYNKILEIVSEPVDYTKVHNILNKEAINSKEWLLNALLKEKNIFEKSVEIRFLQVLLSEGKIPQGIPYLKRAFHKTLKIVKWIFRHTKKQIFLLTNNVNFLRF